MTLRSVLLASVAALGLAATGAPGALVTHVSGDGGPSTDITVADLQNAASGCGLERWAIKVGSDGQRGLVSTTQHQTTIAALRALPKPRSLPRTRLRPTEVSEFVVAGTLLRYKLDGDGDLYLVLTDSAGRSLIVEIADPRCATTSRFRTEITAVRKQFLARFTPTSTFKATRTPIRVRGIGFFDLLHGQSGVAPNGIELHPVLGLRFPTPAPAPAVNPRPSPSPSGSATAPPSPSAPQGTPSPPQGHTTIPTTPCGSGPCINSISDPAPRGSTATATAAGASPDRTCTLSVTLPDGSQSTAAGLGQRTTETNNTASWSWTIDSNTTPGTATAHIACANGPADRSFQIT